MYQEILSLGGYFLIHPKGAGMSCHSISSLLPVNIKKYIPRGDLLRSVPHIKFGDKIKSHRYLDHSGWLGLIYCSNYRHHWRLLLFELENKILWLLKSVCHTVTLRFLHALGPIKSIYLLFMLPNATNFSLNLEHISDFRYVHKQKSYAPNGDFVPFAKFGFVTVWQRKF